jgi:hypothetical protein
MELMQHGNINESCTKLLFNIASALHERELFKNSPIWAYRKTFSLSQSTKMETVLQSHSLSIYTYFISDYLHYILVKNLKF